MKKTVVIHQPDFLPYLGFFHRFLQADLFIVLDHAQFVRGTCRAWTHRDKIKTSAGEKWLSLSVKNAPLGTPINRIELLASDDWRKKNIDLIRSSYREAPYFEEIMPVMKSLYQRQTQMLSDFTMQSIAALMELFDIHIPYVFSSSLEPTESKNKLLVELLKKVGATHYLSGVGAKAYYTSEPFDEAGISVVWQEFIHPIYPQIHGEFIPYLSSIDLLFNCGIQKSGTILRSC